jgi:hypothetical protein
VVVHVAPTGDDTGDDSRANPVASLSGVCDANESDSAFDRVKKDFPSLRIPVIDGELKLVYEPDPQNRNKWMVNDHCLIQPDSYGVCCAYDEFIKQDGYKHVIVWRYEGGGTEQVEMRLGVAGAARRSCRIVEIAPAAPVNKIRVVHFGRSDDLGGVPLKLGAWDARWVEIE